VDGQRTIVKSIMSSNQHISSHSPPPILDSMHDHDCRPYFKKSCQLRKKYQHFSLASSRIIYNRISIIFSLSAEKMSVIFNLFSQKKPVYMLLFMSITVISVSSIARNKDWSIDVTPSVLIKTRS